MHWFYPILWLSVKKHACEVHWCYWSEPRTVWACMAACLCVGPVMNWQPVHGSHCISSNGNSKAPAQPILLAIQNHDNQELKPGRHSPKTLRWLMTDWLMTVPLSVSWLMNWWSSFWLILPYRHRAAAGGLITYPSVFRFSHSLNHRPRRRCGSYFQMRVTNQSQTQD